MKLNLSLITKVSAVITAASALSGCGIQRELQKAKIQSDLMEAQRAASLGNTATTKLWIDRAILADPTNAGTYVLSSAKSPGQDDLSVESVLTGSDKNSASVADYKTAEVYLAKAASQFPSDYHVLRALLNTQKTLGESTAVTQTATNLIAVLEARITAGNVDADVLTTLSGAYWTVGNRQKALANAQKAISIYVADPEVYNGSAYEIAEANSQPDMAQALNNAKIALTKAKQQGAGETYLSAIRDTIAWVEYRQGNYKQAQVDANLALEASPRQAELRYHLAMIYLGEGDKAAAKSELTKALLISPDYADAKTAMAQVKDAPPMSPVAMTGLPDPSAPGTSTLPGG